MALRLAYRRPHYLPMDSSIRISPLHLTILGIGAGAHSFQHAEAYSESRLCGQGFSRICSKAFVYVRAE